MSIVGEANESLLTTRDAARKLGVGPSTIKRWADEGVLECVRTAGGHRRFPRDQVEALLHAHREPPKDFIDHWVDLLSSAPDEYSVLSELYALRSREGTWFKVADRLTLVLEAIGERWATGEISIAQEHTASERLSRALIRTIETLPPSASKPECALCLPEGEHHAFGILLAELCAREAGWTTRAMTVSLPDHEIQALLVEQLPRVLVLSASESSQAQILERLTSNLHPIVQRTGTLTIFGGRGPWPEPVPFGLRMHQYGRFRQALDVASP
ncbi:MAG: excisionase family DNA-binding protein [Myxococcota bacterium]